MDNLQNLQNLPKVIIIHGPNAVGKGTVGIRLNNQLLNYHHLDAGTELREFVLLHIGDFALSEETVNLYSDQKDINIARDIKEKLVNSEPVKTHDFNYVVYSKMQAVIKSGQGLLLEGPGRLIPEAIDMSDFFATQKVSVAIFHIKASLQTVIDRSIGRAKKLVEEGKIPRPEDQDEVVIKKRYTFPYIQNLDQIIQIYKDSGAVFLEFDGEQDRDGVYEDIKKALLDSTEFKRVAGKFKTIKLVRNQVPNKVDIDETKESHFRNLTDDKEFMKYLVKKLVEEANEVQEDAKNDNLIAITENMADLLEVFETIAALKNISLGQIKDIQHQKRLQKGGFDQRLLILQE
jgi:predicted house-cleaning noncanonical NTP pyrophosphatase (MazG superfamily)/adenylate kinase family enzyme